MRHGAYLYEEGFEALRGIMKIAFDIDDTILVPSVAMGNGVSGDNVPHYEVISILRFFQAQGH